MGPRRYQVDPLNTLFPLSPMISASERKARPGRIASMETSDISQNSIEPRALFQSQKPQDSVELLATQEAYQEKVSSHLD